MGYSLGVLGLEMGVTVQEVNARYRFLAVILHPEKTRHGSNGNDVRGGCRVFKDGKQCTTTPSDKN